MNRLIRCSQPTIGLLLACMLALLPGCSSRNTTAPDNVLLTPESSLTADTSSGTSTTSNASSNMDTTSQTPLKTDTVSKTPSASQSASEASSRANSASEASSKTNEPPEGTESLQPAMGDWALRLVNANNSIPETFEPDLAMVADPYRMDARVAPVMKQMIADAKAQGIELLVCSAYRPYSSQKRNFENHMQANINAGLSSEAARADTMRWIALPGTSEHQTGLSADIVTPAYTALDEGYANTKAAKWLKENAAAYGFILRYPSDKTEITGIAFEPWHYRYVGVEAAQKIMSSGVCLEEYLGQA